jgi:hypothetical protein
LPARVAKSDVHVSLPDGFYLPQEQAGVHGIPKGARTE